MKTAVSYALEIKDEYRCFYDTLSIYKKAVSYIIQVVEDNYDEIAEFSTTDKKAIIESLIHTTDNHTAKYKSFDDRFPELPVYFRRGAMNAAIGIVVSHRANLKRWEDEGRISRKPRLKVCRDVMPCFYKTKMFRLSGDAKSYICKLKLYINGKWVWKEFSFRKTDLASIEKKGLKLEDASCPSIEKKGKRFALRFFFDDIVELAETRKRVLACDIGINNAAVACVMEEDGTILARRFLSFPVEENRLDSILNQIRRAHSESACHTVRLNRFANNYNEALSIKVTNAIVEMAIEYKCDVIVMESLLQKMPKVHGSKAYRLSLWRKTDIEKRVENLAHGHGIRFSTVCAMNTSRLAFDGSGVVVRDKNNRSLCTFPNGKRYNCDLSASYNIGARYFAREIWKSFPEKDASILKAKVPELWYGAQCTLSTLLNLYAVKDEFPELSSDWSSRSVFPAS